LISSASSAQSGTSSFSYVLAHTALHSRSIILTCHSQIRQGIANNTKGTAFVVYEDVMDAKSACDKLNGFNFQNRYLVGTQIAPSLWRIVY
jgi:RNA recognition motif-containing protein